MEQSPEKIRKEQYKQLITLMLFAFSVRLVFLHWNQGEYTDGILQITLFTSASQNTFFMPLYTVLATLLNYLIKDMEISAKVVSMVSGVLGIVPLYFLTRRLANHRSGIIVAILYSISPEIWRWHNRVMTDALFCSLFLWSIYHIYVLLENRNEDKLVVHPPTDNLLFHLSLAWLSAGLATFTRYQGLALLPLLIVASFRTWMNLKTKIQNTKSLVIIFLIWTLNFLIWFGIPTWWYMRGSGHLGQYSERMAADLSTTLKSYMIMAEGFIAHFPYILTYPVFIFMLYGIFKTYHQGRRYRIYYSIVGYLFIVWLIAHAPFQSFQYRYFIPILSLFIVPVGCGMDIFETTVNEDGFFTPYRRRWVCFLAVSFCLAFSVVSLFLQRGTFGDIKESALYMKANLQGKRIFDNEQYRTGVDNVKVRYWSGLDIHYYDRNQLRPGDYICLHNVQIDLNRELTWLSQRFVIIPVYDSRITTIPLLPDIMVNPPVTSRPEALSYRYMTQEFVSYLIRIEARDPSSFSSP